MSNSHVIRQWLLVVVKSCILLIEVLFALGMVVKKNCIHDLLLVPRLKKNLFSIQKLTKVQTCIVFTHNGFVVKDLNYQDRLFCGTSFGGLYHVAKEIQASYGEMVNKEMWHSRLGHPSNKVMKSLSPS